RRHTRFSRDWSSDVCSSDLDVSHINDKVVNYVYQTMNVYYECNGVYGNYMHEEEKVESVRDLKDDRYQGVVKFETKDGYDIDVVLAFDYTDKPPKGLEELLETFDMSLNQYGVNEEGMIVTKFDGINVTPVRKDFNQNRLNYIKGKYPQYCYKECDKLFATPLHFSDLFKKETK